jgi:hypothetical protein
MVQEAVKQVDADAGGKVLLSVFLNGAKGANGVQMWSFFMQAIPHSPNGNYLYRFFLSLYDAYPDIAKKLAEKVIQKGVALSPSSGHFDNLTHLNPRESVPSTPAKGTENVPMGRWIDAFTEVSYDLEYRRRQKGFLSETLQLKYQDGRRLDVDIRVIADNRDPAPMQSTIRSYVGQAGVLMPLRLGPDTTPRLWRAKHDKALAGMTVANDDFLFFVTASTTAIFATLPTGPVVGPVPVETVPPVRAPAPRGRPAPSAVPDPVRATGPTPAGRTTSKPVAGRTPAGDPAVVRPASGRPAPSETAVGPTITIPPPGSPGYPGALGEVIGAVPRTRLPSSPWGSTRYGQAMEPEMVSVVKQRFPNSRFRFRTGRGNTGPDVEWIGGEDPGFHIGDFKPDSTSGYAKFVAQVRRLWSGGTMAKPNQPFRAAAIMYQHDGTIFIGDVGTAASLRSLRTRSGP